MTTISWTDATWNPVTGCTKVSPGCLNCYAESITRRFKARMQPYSEAFIPWTVKAQRESGQPAVTLHPERLEDPLHWKHPRKVFVNSMSDLFHEDVPDSFILRVWITMAMAKEHTFQVLTKRPKRMQSYLTSLQNLPGEHQLFSDDFWPLPNVWLGVSVENQRYADERIPFLLRTSAAVRFISAEPLLGPVDVIRWMRASYPESRLFNHAPQIDQVITGCESGPKRRPMETDWVRSLRDQCQVAGVPFFLKQVYMDGKKVELPELDGKVWAEYPHA